MCRNHGIYVRFAKISYVLFVLVNHHIRFPHREIKSSRNHTLLHKNCRYEIWNGTIQLYEPPNYLCFIKDSMTADALCGSCSWCLKEPSKQTNPSQLNKLMAVTRRGYSYLCQITASDGEEDDSTIFKIPYYPRERKVCDFRHPGTRYIMIF